MSDNRFYLWPETKDVYVPSVTTVTESVAPKGGLTRWMKEQAMRAVLEHASCSEEIQSVLAIGLLSDTQLDDLTRRYGELWHANSERESEKALAIGNAVHRISEAIDREQPDWDEASELYDDTIGRCVIAYKQWRDLSVDKVLGIETVVYGQIGLGMAPPFQYAGKRDRRFVLKKGAVIHASGDKRRKLIYAEGGEAATVDLKTSADHYPQYGLQLAAYAHAAKTPDDLILTVRLDKETGQFYVKQWSHVENLIAFANAISLWQHFNPNAAANYAKKQTSV